MDNTQRQIVSNTLNRSSLSEDIVYEVGEFGKKQSFLSGILEGVNLPDVQIKPHRDMTTLLLATASILSIGAMGTAYIYRTK